MFVNRIGFQDWLKKNLISSVNTNVNSDANKLYPYQRLVRNYLGPETPYRGVLLYHGLGVGKTMSAVSICENNDKKAVIMLPASIEQNFINEIIKSGNQLYKKYQNHWVHIPNTAQNKTKLDNLSKVYGDDVASKVIKKYKGLWEIAAGKEPNYDKLDETEQNGISLLVSLLIQQKYQFVHYNGVSLDSEAIFKSNDPQYNHFDNKIVVIDEVHNFISRVVSGSKVSRKIYEQLLKSKTVRVILLSGTPLINKPVELAYLLNLVRGYIREKKFTYLKESSKYIDSFKEELEKNLFVDYYNIQSEYQTINIGLCPEGFKYSDKENYMLVKTTEETPDFEKILKDKKIVLSKKATTHDVFTPLLPHVEEDFENLFIDYDNTTIVNQQMLSRRIQGLVSYYEYYDIKDYPKASEMKIVEIEMTPDQLSKYLPVRAQELERERIKRQQQNKSDKDMDKDNMKGAGNVYKSFSRALCNFVFPEDVTRPYPSQMRLSTKEVEDEDGEENEEKTDSKSDYEKALKKAITKLEKTSALKDDLKNYSPKMLQIYENIKASPGHVLVYSNFRTVEGLFLFSKVLELRGYHHLKVIRKAGELSLDLPDSPKPMFIQFTGKKDENQLLLNIYNSNFSEVPATIMEQLEKLYGMKNLYKHMNLRGEIIRVLMITQSGSEGISLKNVRQVHLMEPYWNEIRIKQVIGRAIRAKSHLDLPPSERTVDVFMYMMKFKKESVKDAKVVALDKFMTSDQIIYSIAQKKSQISDALLNIVKGASIDCHRNQKVHGDKVKCFEVMKKLNKKNDILYPTAIKDDVQDKHLEQIVHKVIKKTVFKMLKHGEKEYVYDTETGDLYLPADIKKKDKQPIGKVIFDENGKLKGMRLIKK